MRRTRGLQCTTCLMYNEGLPWHWRRKTVDKYICDICTHTHTRLRGPPIRVFAPWCQMLWLYIFYSPRILTLTYWIIKMQGDQKLLKLKSPHPKHPKHLILHKHIHAASNHRLPTFSSLISSTVLLHSLDRNPTIQRISIIESYHINERDLSHFISFHFISMMLLCSRRVKKHGWQTKKLQQLLWDVPIKVKKTESSFRRFRKNSSVLGLSKTICNLSRVLSNL